MRIAVDLVPVRPDGSAGGVTGVAIELLKALLKRENVELVLLCADWNREYLFIVFGKSVEYNLVATENKNTGKWKYVKKIFSKFGMEKTKKYSADILFCPFSAVNYKQEGIPTVCTINDIQHEFYPQFFAPEEHKHRRRFYKNVVNNAERVICISNYTRDSFCQHYGYAREKAITVYIAIQERFGKEDKNILKKLNVIKGEYIVFPANFWEHKNHKLLLVAFAMYAQSHEKGKLVLTGNVMKQEDYYNQMLNAMNLEERVIITGYLNEEELYAVLKNAKGLIYPSLFEGFGIPLVEAMQMNKLIASSNLTSLPEVGCKSIFYFNPKKPDEILEGIQFLFETELSDEIREDYQLQLKKYTIDGMAKGYLSVFKEVIENGEECRKSVSVNGVFGDGWTQGIVNFHLRKHKGDVLCIYFNAPGYLKAGTKLYIKNGKTKYKYKYNQGETHEILEIIQEDNIDIQLILSNTWNPQKVMQSEDNRELGIMIEKMELLTREGVEEINIV